MRTNNKHTTSGDYIGELCEDLGLTAEECSEYSLLLITTQKMCPGPGKPKVVYDRKFWISEKYREVVRYSRSDQPDAPTIYQVCRYEDLPTYKNKHYATWQTANLSKAFVWSICLGNDPACVPKHKSNAGYAYSVKDGDWHNLTQDNYVVITNEEAQDYKQVELEAEARKIVNEWRKAERIAEWLNLPLDLIGKPDRLMVLKYQQYKAGTRKLTPGEIPPRAFASLEQYFRG